MQYNIHFFYLKSFFQTFILPFFSFFLIFSIFPSSSVTAQERSAEEMKNIVRLDSVKIKNAGIQTVEPTIGTFEKTLFAIGRIKAIPANHTVVSSRIAGKVVSRPPVVGDQIKKNQTVLHIESRQPGSPPPVIKIKAPANGTIFQSHVKLGEPVEPSEELMDIVDIRKVWAVANIPESKASQVKIGQTAHIRVVSLGDKIFKGKLIRFGTEADVKTGSVQAIFLLDNPDLKLRPNMLTEFNIITETRENVFSVPKSAIQGDQLTAHLFKADYELEHSFLKVPVVLGEENHEQIEIIIQDPDDPEINMIDSIVVRGGYFLTHTQADKQSLKEALDEAHGHEHNEDGSEMTAEQKAAKAKEKQAAQGGQSGGEHSHGASSQTVILLWCSNGILFILLLVTLIKKKSSSV